MHLVSWSLLVPCVCDTAAWSSPTLPYLPSPPPLPPCACSYKRRRDCLILLLVSAASSSSSSSSCGAHHQTWRLYACSSRRWSAACVLHSPSRPLRRRSRSSCVMVRRAASLLRLRCSFALVLAPIIRYAAIDAGATSLQISCDAARFSFSVRRCRWRSRYGWCSMAHVCV